MLLKKYSYLLFAGLLATSFVSCKDDDGGTIIDGADPEVTLTSPTEAQLTEGFTAGDMVTVSGTITDNRDLKTVMLTVTAPGETTPFVNETWGDDDFTEETLALNQSFTIPATAEEGVYVMRLMAVDDAGNDYDNSWELNVMAATNANVTVNVPTGTSETAEVEIVMVGADGADNTAYALTRNEAGAYVGSLMFPEGAAQQFYFRIVSDDDTNADKFMEVNDDCSMLTADYITANRTYTGTNAEVDLPAYTVAAWQNMDAAMGGCTP